MRREVVREREFRGEEGREFGIESFCLFVCRIEMEWDYYSTEWFLY